jgi:hypothetical protein
VTRFTSSTPSAERFDATGFLPALGTPAWEAIVADMQRHTSQFDQRWIDAVRNVPSQDRAVYIAPAEQALQQPIETCR